jgi:hypothetical protein
MMISEVPAVPPDESNIEHPRSNTQDHDKKHSRRAAQEFSLRRGPWVVEKKIAQSRRGKKDISGRLTVRHR